MAYRIGLVLGGVMIGAPLESLLDMQIEYSITGIFNDLDAQILWMNIVRILLGLLMVGWSYRWIYTTHRIKK